MKFFNIFLNRIIEQDKSNKKIFPIIIVSILILMGGATYCVNPSVFSFLNLDKNNATAPRETVDKAVSFINENILSQQGITASLIGDITEESGLYKFKLNIGEEKFDFFITKNGKLFFTQYIELEQESQNATNSEITQTEIPNVKLFIMSYCPYGLQAQKMFLPVYDLLKDKADMEIYFVDYIMHGKKEIDENLRQYCIQKEQEEKYYDYATCFVSNDDYEICLNSVSIDKTKLNDCVLKTDEQYKITEQYNDKNTWLNETYPKFDIHSELNDMYEVKGSPSIVINDKEINLNSRSPESFKKAICEAFIEKPKECSEILSDQAFAPGFGQGIGDSSAGKCE